MKTMSKIGLGIGLVILGFFLVVMVQTATSSLNTKEVQVGTLNVSGGMNAPEDYMLKLPANTTEVTVKYDLNATNLDGNIAPNGNMGTANGVQQGEDPWKDDKMVDSKYLSGSNEQLVGNFTFNPGDYFVYSGMFTGNLTVYATVPT